MWDYRNIKIMKKDILYNYYSSEVIVGIIILDKVILRLLLLEIKDLCYNDKKINLLWNVVIINFRYLIYIK